MPKKQQVQAPIPAAKSRLPILILLFVGSGCAALIYEVVWLQLLQLVIGSSAVSLGVLLGTFMGGMCLGSFLLPRAVDAGYHPLKVYAGLELGIGAAGLLLLWGMPLVNTLYAAVGGGHIVLRALIAAVCLLPPTLMMGATLPAIARWVETTPAGVSWMGVFYAGNIGGAVLGSLLAGFYLLRVHDMAIATYAAAGLNAIVALIGLRLSTRAPYRPAAFEPAASSAARTQRSTSQIVYLAIAVSGLTALASQVIWTRLLSLVFGATVYAFSLILAVFLAGLGIGSAAGAALGRRANPRAALGWCQMLLCGAMAGAGYLIAGWLPYLPNETIADPWARFQLDLWRCLPVVLPGAILWGASFPLALAAVARPGQDPGRLVGGMYAANTAGAIAGSLGASLIMVRALGTLHAQQLLIVFSMLSALVLLTTHVAGSVARARTTAIVLAVAAASAAGLAAWRIPSIPGTLAAYGRYSATWMDVATVLYVGEGLNAVVAVSRGPTGVLSYHAAGKVQASSEGEDMRLQRMLGHFSHLLPAAPRNVLVIGLGAGATAGAVSIGPGVERMTIAEIEALAVAGSRYFEDYNYRVMDNPKVELRVDDARHVLLTTSETFDAITSDLVDPWVKGVATLFTREFFELVKRHLNPGGVVTQFVQLYESNTEAVKSEIATFVEVFPNTIVWGNPNEGQGYDLVLTGQVEPFRIDVDQWQARLDSPQYAEVARSLREIGIGSAVELLSNYAGSAADLAPWLADATINRDRTLRLQYLAGMGMNQYRSGSIYAEMLRYAKFPEDVFTGSPSSVQALKAAVERGVNR
jgi:spermidine synthase